MTLPFCRLAPPVLWKFARALFPIVAFQHILSVIISQISAFVNSLTGFFPKKGNLPLRRISVHIEDKLPSAAGIPPCRCYVELSGKV